MLKKETVYAEITASNCMTITFQKGSIKYKKSLFGLRFHLG